MKVKTRMATISKSVLSLILVLQMGLFFTPLANAEGDGPECIGNCAGQYCGGCGECDEEPYIRAHNGRCTTGGTEPAKCCAGDEGTEDCQNCHDCNCTPEN